MLPDSMQVTSGATPESSLLFQTNDIPRARSPSKSPRRIHTDPQGEVSKCSFKRILVFCDGTWQDGVLKERSHYTNVLRLARTINREDARVNPPIPQVVFYQSGIGSANNFYSQYVEGTTGGTLADKVEDAYAFIAHNYDPGDEIFLFGFSRGAYTARMVAMFIGEIGVLDRRDMDSFASIFIDYQSLGKCKDLDKKLVLEDKLAPWRSAGSKGKQRVDIDGNKFTIKCLGVWDTVGSLGLPEELHMPTQVSNMFGFPDHILGGHIEYAFQALALNEMRLDFNCNKFTQTEEGRRQKQTLKQCWFAGCHSDIGGGYKHHDLADLALIWMAANVDILLSLDEAYLRGLLQPVAPWGTQHPHDSATGIFLLANTVQRTLPTKPDDPKTHESFHPSILQQTKLDPSLSEKLARCPELVSPLLGLEEQMRVMWPYDPKSSYAQAYTSKLQAQGELGGLTISKTTSWIRTIIRSVSHTPTSVNITTEEKVVVEKRERKRTVMGSFDAPRSLRSLSFRSRS